MKNICLITVVLLLAAIKINAQCLVTPQFQLTGAACPGLPITITNTSISSGTSTYNWDFCAGDLQNVPVSSYSHQYPNAIGQSLGMDLAFDGTDYYVFVANSGLNAPGRVQYFNSLSNPGVDNLLTGIPGAGFNIRDLKIVNVDTNWFVFACGGNDVERIDFGNSLANPNPVATVLNTGGVLNTPYSLDFVQDNGQYYLLVANSGSTPSSVSVLDLGNDIFNAAPAVTTHSINGVAKSVSAVKACDQWYGFVANAATNIITRIDFGNSLSNPTPLITDDTIPGLPGVYEIEVKHDDGKWYAFVNIGSELLRVDYGVDITNNTPTWVSLGGFGSFTGDCRGFTIKKFGSSWIGVTNEFSNATVKQFIFPEQCNIQPAAFNSDSVPPVITYGDGGWHHIELEMLNNGGVSLFADSIFINPFPLPSFQFSPSCINRATQFTNLTTIASGYVATWNWDFGDGSNDTSANPIHIYSTTDTNTVTLTAISNAGCIDSVKQTLTVYSNPAAQFFSTGSLCSTYGIQFNDSSIDTAGNITNWFWDFDDQQSDTLQSPVHTFANAGLYNVSLIVTSTTGCADTAINAVNIQASPLTSFTIFNTCIGDTVMFANQTSIPDTSSLFYQWNFGDSDTSNQINPSHSYSLAVADYNVLLIAQSTNGCSDSSLQLIHIGNKPQTWFSFLPDTACAGNAILFSDSSFIATGDTITAWYWDFGDNSYDSISKNPTHIFQNSGTFSVRLTAHSPASCDSTVTRTVFVIASPQANFSTANICFGNNTPFNDLSTAPSGSAIVSWQWSFGDSTFNSSPNTTHNYSQYGTYNVLLQVTSNTGCVDTFSRQVQVYELPQASFTNSTGCSGNAVTFTDHTLVATDSITAWSWNFGDSSGSNASQNPTHIYANANSYSVNLITTTSHGCKDTALKNIIVYQSPQFIINFTPTCFGSQTQFGYTLSTVTPFINLTWDFGDSTTSHSPVPSPHVYASVDTFNVILTITDLSTTCTTTDSVPLIVKPKPSADFASMNHCTNQDVILHDSSSISSGSIVNWNWTVNNTPVSSQQNPALQITAAGNYNVQLQVTSDAGCKDSSSQTINIYAPPIPLFTANPPYGSPGNASSFISQTVNGFSHAWNFGDNGLNGTDSVEMHTYQDTGVYYVTLITTNIEGCADTLIKPYHVLIPMLDIAVINITYKRQGNLLNVIVTLLNAGNIDIQNTEIKATIEGFPVIHEFPVISIPAANVRTYTLASNIEVSNNSPAYICIEALNPNNQQDMNSSNNLLCKDLNSEFSLISVTPNPASSDAHININVPAKGNISVVVNEAQGKIVYNKEDVVVQKGFNSILMNVASWSKGLYAVTIKYQDNYKTLKFISE